MHTRAMERDVARSAVKSQLEIGHGDTQKADSDGRVRGSVSGAGEPELSQVVSRLIEQMSPKQLAALLVLTHGLQRDSQNDPLAEE